jgi:hypothetical protein
MMIRKALFVRVSRSFLTTRLPALLAAILDLFPDLLPLLTPLEWPLADGANLFK